MNIWEEMNKIRFLNSCLFFVLSMINIAGGSGHNESRCHIIILKGDKKTRHALITSQDEIEHGVIFCGVVKLCLMM